MVRAPGVLNNQPHRITGSPDLPGPGSAYGAAAGAGRRPEGGF